VRAQQLRPWVEPAEMPSLPPANLFFSTLESLGYAAV
jgi:hypothetical protein